MQAPVIYSPSPLNDYRLIVDVPRTVRKKIAVIKTALDLDYKGTVIAGGNPFIYLATFSQREAKEDTIAEALNKIALGFMPFKIHLKDFGHVDNKEICITIEESKVILQLINAITTLNEYFLNARYNELPRIAVAQRLQPWQFEKSWNTFGQRHFSATFLAAEMLLLKRSEGFRSWQVLKHMVFENLLIKT